MQNGGNETSFSEQVDSSTEILFMKMSRKEGDI